MRGDLHLADSLIFPQDQGAVGYYPEEKDNYTFLLMNEKESDVLIVVKLED